MLFTTNKSPVTAWGALLHDADLAEAIVNRADFAALDVHLIVETALRLDRREDQQRLHLTVAKLRSRLLILDPFRASAARRRVMCAAYLALTMQGAEAPPLPGAGVPARGVCGRARRHGADVAGPAI
ncbi:MAG: hypothetical protein OXG35_11050 [Acidobacteria bacterium]|nr:hypothetical protein [Acidobacteriota bacterium]